MKTLTRHIPEGYLEYTPKFFSDGEKTEICACYIDMRKPEHYIAMFFIGKQSKPAWHHRFKTPEAMAKYIEESVHSLESRILRKLERREKRKSATAGVQVGQIYSYSWGYDQTNVDFYQVIEVTGKTFKVREIYGKGHGEAPSGSMSDNVSAVKDSFIEKEEPILKRSLSMPHGILSLTNETEKHFNSWYA